MFHKSESIKDSVLEADSNLEEYENSRLLEKTLPLYQVI